MILTDTMADSLRASLRAQIHRAEVLQRRLAVLTVLALLALVAACYMALVTPAAPVAADPAPLLPVCLATPR